MTKSVFEEIEYLQEIINYNKIELLGQIQFIRNSALPLKAKDRLLTLYLPVLMNYFVEQKEIFLLLDDVNDKEALNGIYTKYFDQQLGIFYKNLELGEQLIDLCKTAMKISKENNDYIDQIFFSVDFHEIVDVSEDFDSDYEDDDYFDEMDVFDNPDEIYDEEDELEGPSYTGDDNEIIYSLEFSPRDSETVEQLVDQLMDLIDLNQKIRENNNNLNSIASKSFETHKAIAKNKTLIKENRKQVFKR